MKIETNITSSLEKVRADLKPSDYPRLERPSALIGEHINFQLLINIDADIPWNRDININAESDLGDIRLREVKNVAVSLDSELRDPTRGTEKFLDYPGKVYPDILEPLQSGNLLRPIRTVSVWADITIPEGTCAGDHTITLTVKKDGELLSCEKLVLHVVPAVLPKDEYVCTNWFHLDCLASYYEVPIFSERHFEIIENFMSAAVENGINTLLVPIFTPPLDTKIGTERPTVQLVAVRRDDGKYSFDFSLFDRYIALCQKAGVKNFEISHLFTQWGAKFAPKVVADVCENGVTSEKRIFGWDTSGTEGEYPVFLSVFLPKLRSHLEELGILDRCFFHISDEPQKDQIAGYIAAKNIVAPYLKGCKIIDACSHPEIVTEGAIEIPVPTTDNMPPFLALDLPMRWTYYCCCQLDNCTNRLIAYPSQRTRILGVQMYKYNITGFLQWAFNFYYTRGSVNLVNPFTDMSGGGWVPAGDTFVVYPGRDGKPVESLRLKVFAEAFSDLRALKLCEALCGRDAVLAVIDEKMPITFKEYPTGAAYLLTLREKINKMIEEKLTENGN